MHMENLHGHHSTLDDWLALKKSTEFTIQSLQSAAHFNMIFISILYKMKNPWHLFLAERENQDTADDYERATSFGCRKA